MTLVGGWFYLLFLGRWFVWFVLGVAFAVLLWVALGFLWWCFYFVPGCVMALYVACFVWGDGPVFRCWVIRLFLKASFWGFGVFAGLFTFWCVFVVACCVVGCLVGFLFVGYFAGFFFFFWFLFRFYLCFCDVVVGFRFIRFLSRFFSVFVCAVAIRFRLW